MRNGKGSPGRGEAANKKRSRDHRKKTFAVGRKKKFKSQFTRKRYRGSRGEKTHKYKVQKKTQTHNKNTIPTHTNEHGHLCLGNKGLTRKTNPVKADLSEKRRPIGGGNQRRWKRGQKAA